MENQVGTLSLLVQLHAPCPCLICSPGPQSQSFFTELRPTAKCLNAGCTALLIIQFVEKHLPIWHFWCSSYLLCLNGTEEGGGVALISILSHHLYRFCVVGFFLFNMVRLCWHFFRKPAVFSLIVFRDILYSSLRSFIFKHSFPALESSACSTI